MEEHAVAAPAVEHGLRSWFTVDLNQYRIFLSGIKVGRLHHPAVDCYTVTGINLEKLCRRREELRDLFLVFGAVAARAYKLVIRQRHQLAQPRIIETGE